MVVDNVIYKEKAGVASGRSASLGAAPRRSNLVPPPPPPPPVSPGHRTTSDGFQTPRDGEGRCEAAAAPSLAEWAPFGPSLPYGEQPVMPGSPPPPYWLECDASLFAVRNIRYKLTQEKVPSDFALYQCVGMDMLRDKRRIDAVMDRLPSGVGLPTSPAATAEWSPSWGIPRVLVINCQVPLVAGNMFGAHPEDDGGVSVLVYLVLSRQASELVSRGATTPALRLWRRFVEEGVSTKDGIALKVVGRVEDLEKHEVPESFHRFNNKPVLLTKSATVLSGRLPEVLEIDHDVRPWVYPARAALATYRHRAKEAELEVGYLVEGKTDDELPEQMLGCIKLNNLDILLAKSVSVM